MNPNLRELLGLLGRSAKPGEWATVSKICMPLLDEAPSDLIEVEKHEDGSGRARFTDNGLAVFTYL